MATSLLSNPGTVVIDSNVLIAICAKETSQPTAEKALAAYSNANWIFYAPGVVALRGAFAAASSSDRYGHQSQCGSGRCADVDDD